MLRFAAAAGILLGVLSAYPPDATPRLAAAALEAPGVDDAAQPGEPQAAEPQAEAHEESPFAFASRVVNFAVLVGGLGYFLREPVKAYLEQRSRQIRQDLVEAAALKTAAGEQLARIDAQLESLPHEIEALRARGAEEIAAQETRMQQQTEAERARLMDQARREIDLLVRNARRELTELAADLAVASASDRLRSETTPDDHARLIDRYARQLSSMHE